jgi:peptide/nickel transport system substrate-binding protein
MRRLTVGAMAMGLLGSAVLTACSSTNSTPPAPSRDLVIVRASDSSSLDTTTVSDNNSIWVMQQLQETLYKVTPDGKNEEPSLATSYTVSPDKLTWTFTLRSGVKFSNGQPMTSADVKFSLDAAKGVSGGWSFIDTAMATVSAPDPNTIVIKTKYPWAPLLADISCFNNSIVPKDYAGMTKAAFYQSPIGTGPFMWSSWAKGNALKMVKNPVYWQPGKPWLNSVTWKVESDDNTRLLQLQGGQANIDENPPFSTLDQIKAIPGLKAQIFPGARVDYMFFNEKKPPFGDVHVRRAISYAVDRQSIVKAVLFGNGTVANSFIPPTVTYYDPNTKGQQFDMAAAAAELAKSTVPKGFAFTYVATAGDQTDQAVAQILQASLKQLGITMTIKNVDASTELTLLNSTAFEMLHYPWTMDIADPDELVSFATDPGAGGMSFSTYYNNPLVIAADRAAERTFDPTERAKLYSFVQQQDAADAQYAYLYYAPYKAAFGANVHGFVIFPTGNYHLEDVAIG